MFLRNLRLSRTNSDFAVAVTNFSIPSVHRKYYESIQADMMHSLNSERMLSLDINIFYWVLLPITFVVYVDISRLFQCHDKIPVSHSSSQSILTVSYLAFFAIT
jgi:hypothetical protein